MGVEIVNAADITQVPVKDGIEGEKSFENKESNGELKQAEGIIEPIKFGSHGADVPAKGEGEAVKSDSFPKDAVEDWPEPKQIHYFYFVRVRPYEDPKLKIKIEQSEKELQKKNQARFQLTDAIKAKRSERAQIISQLKPLSVEDKRYRSVMDDRRKEMEPLNEALGKLRSATKSSREGGVVICSSEEELDSLIHSLNYRISHESNTLVEEKQMLREIKQLEGTRDRVIANAALKAKIQDSLGQKEAIQDQVKLLGNDMDGVRKEKQGIRAKIKQLEDELKIVDDEISSMQGELELLNGKKDKVYEGLVELRKQRDEGNAHYYQNRSRLNNLRELATKKDVAAVEELCQSEVEKFMTVWNSNKSFRADYEKRMLQSLDQRQLSRDARIRNPGEKLLVEARVVVPAEPEPVAKPLVKRPKEEPKLSVQPEKVVKKEEPVAVKKIEEEEKENIFTVEKIKKKPPVDPAKLKEMKREEELAKAKMALERKKKLAEKNAIKAAVRAQKEAEKKLKEREKRAKKKAGGANPDEQVETEEEVVEPESVTDESTELSPNNPVTSKTKAVKDNSVRYRKRGKGTDTLPKAILKRKKSTPIWVWAVPVAVLVVLLLALGYYYLL
ncbi:hypothetical protein ACHQM5_003223 [Ranunculus cassubicifolius]